MDNVVNFLKSIPNKIYLISGASMISLFAIKLYNMGPIAKVKKDIKGKIIIVTGSHKGIAKITALELINRGATVIFACCDETKAKEVINSIKDESLRQNAVYMHLDLSKLTSVMAFINKFKIRFRKLDYLINNDDIISEDYMKTEDEMEITLQTNYYSPVILSVYLLDNLKSENGGCGGRIINVSSSHYKKSYRFDFKKLKSIIPEKYNFQKEFSSCNQFSLSKACLNIFTQYLADISHQKQLGVQVCSLHPGIMLNCQSNLQYNSHNILTKFIFNIFQPIRWLYTQSDYRGCQTTLHCVNLENDEFVNGGYYGDCSEKELLEFCKNKENIESLVKFTKDMVKFYGQQLSIEIKV